MNWSKLLGIILGTACIFFIVLFFIQPSGCTNTGAGSGTPKPTHSAGQEYECPVDFEKLQKVNEDIYAWITIPNTYIDYPVVQSSDNDKFYLTHNSEREKERIGALFTEHNYNGTDFDDKVTVIYGHHTVNGSMFGDLEALYSGDGFSEYKDIIIYMPDKELHYEVFAAVPYSKVHILYANKKFEEEGTLAKFIETIAATNDFSVNIDKSVSIEESDKILILSTCLQRNNKKRYLVVARLTETINN